MQGARGDRARVPSQKTVGRWLDRWVEDGLMVSERVPNTKGRAFLIYRTSRALSLKSCPLSEPLPEFFQRKGSGSDNTEGEEQVVRTEEVVTEGGPALAAGSDTPKSVRTTNPVDDSVLGVVRTKDIPTGTTRAPVRAETEDATPCWEAEDYPGDYADDSGCALP